MAEWEKTPMLLNADFTKRASLHADAYQWVASPQAGVERVMLDRIGGEKARATSIVRYARHSHFPAHTHPAGEEFLVLSGTFSEHGADFPAGWYVRNPPGSAHQPSSEDGAIIFVKLRQMPTSETGFVRIDTNDPANWVQQCDRTICPLFSSDAEQVTIERVPPHAQLLPAAVKGAEILILGGDVHENGQAFAKGSWIRLPEGAYPAITAGPSGSTLYVKRGAFTVDPSLAET
jgi:anti-sigma factor ChrR (cupin superfamily)